MRTVVLLSGGLDSMVLAEELRLAGDLAGCVFVDYGHPAQIQEGWRAFAYCGSRSVRLKVVHAFGIDLGDMGTSVGARIVHARNSILVALAANATRSLGGDSLAIGAIADDQADYEDCRPSFLAAMQAATGVQVVAPLIGASKADVVARARVIGLDLDLSWSCYGPGPDPCGVCPSCVQRATATGWGGGR